MDAIGKQYPLDMKTRQLWASMKLNPKPLDYQAYREAEAAQPKFWCHVWVKKAGHDKECVQDCDAPEHASWSTDQLEEERKRWIKSTLPTEVQLREPPTKANLLQHCIKGLLREEFSMPVLCIVTPTEHFKTLDKDKQDFESLKKAAGEKNRPVKMQMVPMQFVGGKPSMWVNLGSKIIWESFTGTAAFIAFLLPLGEIVYSLCHYGKMIKTCDDILNTDCVFFDNSDTEGHPVDFRTALGFKAAVSGCICAGLASLCIHVANASDAAEISEKQQGCWTFSRYFWAIYDQVCMLPKLCSCCCPTRSSQRTMKLANLDMLDVHDAAELSEQ